MGRGSRGLTLIEMLVVIAIMALMLGMIVVSFATARTSETIRAVNGVANLMRYGYDKARVTGSHYRLTVDFDKGTFMLQEGDDRMYLPATDRDGKLVEFDESKAEEKANRDKRAEDAFNQSVQAEVFAPSADTDGSSAAGDPYAAQFRKVPRRKPPLFNSFEDENALSGLTKPIKLPEDMKIKSLRTDADLKPISKGEAYVYFFPRGRTQKAHILLEDDETDARWTIKLAPLTGRVSIHEGHEELTLPDDPGDEEDELGQRRTRRTF